MVLSWEHRAALFLEQTVGKSGYILPRFSTGSLPVQAKLKPLIKLAGLLDTAESQLDLDEK